MRSWKGSNYVFFASDRQVQYDGKQQMNLFRSDETVHEFQSLQVLAWTQSYGKKIKFAVYKGHQLASPRGNLRCTYAIFLYTSGLGLFPRGPFKAASGTITSSTN